MAKLVAIVGPTATGKTELATKMAQKHQGEIICADSRTIYRGMDVGTAKPTTVERELVPHHLLDIRDPGQNYSAAEFKADAQRLIAKIRARNHLPIICGGSGLYVYSLIYDYQFPTITNQRQSDDRTLLDLVDELISQDPDLAAQIDLKNRRRVERTLATIGSPKSKSNHLSEDTILIGIYLNKEIAQQRLRDRAQAMIETGIVDEVRRLADKFGWDNEAMKGILYRTFRPVVEGQKSVEEGLADFITADWQLYRRQLTWWRRNHDVVWCPAAAEAEAAIDQFLATV